MFIYKNIIIYFLICFFNYNIASCTEPPTDPTCPYVTAPDIEVTLALFLAGVLPFPDCQFGIFFALTDGVGSENTWCAINTSRIIISSLIIAQKVSCQAWKTAKSDPYTAPFAEALQTGAYYIAYAASIELQLLQLNLVATITSLRIETCKVAKDDVWPAAYPDDHIRQILISMGEQPTVNNIIDKYDKICLRDKLTGARIWLKYGECWDAQYMGIGTTCAYAPENVDSSVMLCGRVGFTCPCAINVDFGLLTKPNYQKDGNGVIKTSQKRSNGVLENTLLIKDDGTLYARSANYYNNKAGLHCRVLRVINKSPTTPQYYGIIDDVCNNWSGYSKNQVTLTAGVVQCIVNTMRNLFEKPMTEAGNTNVSLTTLQKDQYNQYISDIATTERSISIVTNVSQNSQNASYTSAPDLINLINMISGINNRSLFGALTGPTYKQQITTISSQYQNYINIMEQINAINIVINNDNLIISQQEELTNRVCKVANRINILQGILNSCNGFVYSQREQSFGCSNNVYSSYINSYGAWNNSDCASPVGSNITSVYSFIVTNPNNQTYTVKFAGDNHIRGCVNGIFTGNAGAGGTVGFNGQVCNGTSGFSSDTYQSISTTTISLLNGLNILTLDALNDDGPGIYAVSIFDSSGNSVFNTKSATSYPVNTYIIGSNFFGNNCKGSVSNNATTNTSFNPNDNNFCISECYGSLLSLNQSVSTVQIMYNNLITNIINTQEEQRAISQTSCADLQQQLAISKEKLQTDINILKQYKLDIDKLPTDFYTNIAQINSDLSNLLQEIKNDSLLFTSNALTNNAGYGVTPFQSLQGAVTAFLLIIFVLFLVLLGYRMINDQINADISDFMPYVINIALIYYLALGTAWKDWLINVILNTANGFGQLALQIPLGVVGNSDKCQFYQPYYIPQNSSKCDFPSPNGSLEMQTVAYDPKSSKPIQGCIKGPYIPMPNYELIYKPVVYSVLNKNAVEEPVLLQVYCRNDVSSGQYVPARVTQNLINNDYLYLYCPNGYTMEDGYRVSELNKMGISNKNLQGETDTGVIHTALYIGGSTPGSTIDIITPIISPSLQVAVSTKKYKNKLFMESIRASMNKLERYYPVVHQYGVKRDMSYVALFDTLDCKAMSYFGYNPNTSIDVSAPSNIMQEDVMYFKFLSGLFVAFPFGWVISFLLLVFGLLFISMVFRAAQSYIISMSMLMILFFMCPLVIPLRMFEKTKSFFDGWLQKVIGYIVNVPTSLFLIGLMMLISDYAVYGAPSQYVTYNSDGSVLNYVFNEDGSINKNCATDSTISSAPLVCLAYFFNNHLIWVGLTASSAIIPVPNVGGDFYIAIIKTLLLAIGVVVAIVSGVDGIEKLLTGVTGASTTVEGSPFNTNSFLAKAVLSKGADAVKGTAKAGAAIGKSVSNEAKGIGEAYLESRK